MHIKKVLKAVAMVCLAVVMCVTMFGCGDKTPEEEHLAQHYENIIYYFEQFFKDGWTLNGDPSNKYMNPDEKLVITITKNADPASGVYSVYKQQAEHPSLSMTSSLESTYAAVTNPEHDLYFNKLMGERESFKITNDEAISVVYNGYQFHAADYTFSKEGSEWKGRFHLIMHSKQYYVVAYEAKADKWDAFEPDFKDMINDWWMLGYENDQ